MKLAWEDVSPVARDLGQMLQRPVAFFDLSGCPVGESDPGPDGGRIQVFAAQLNQAGAVPVQVDEKGGLLALMLEGQPVGVLAVDAAQQADRPQLEMAKRLAELMLEEHLRQDQEAADKQSRQALLEKWICNAFLPGDQSFETRMQINGIDITGPHVVAVLRLFTPEMGPIAPEMWERMGNMLPTYLSRVENLVDTLILDEELICLFASGDELAVQRELRSLKNVLEASYPICLCGGIGKACQDYTQVHESYVEADKACTISQKSRQTQVVRYNELSIDLLVEEIPDQIKTDFVNKVFANCKKSELEEWRVLLRAFFVSNGSISKVAEELFIHKNTLQYKLNKIREQTGYDPRSTCDALKLYLAILFSENQSIY